MCTLKVRMDHKRMHRISWYTEHPMISFGYGASRRSCASVSCDARCLVSAPRKVVGVAGRCEDDLP